MRRLALEMDTVIEDMVDRVVALEGVDMVVAEVEAVDSVAGEAGGDYVRNLSDTTASHTKGSVKTGVWVTELRSQ